MRYEENTLYHLYNQTNGYAPLFREAANYRFFLGKLRQHLCPLAGILCYCLMPDHFHLIIEPKAAGVADSTMPVPMKQPGEGARYQQNIAQALRTIKSSYTRAMNRRYKTRGALFRANTGQKVLDTPRYAATCFRYIHQNPVKDGLVREAAHYPWSSARAYLGQANCPVTEVARGRQLGYG